MEKVKLCIITLWEVKVSLEKRSTIAHKESDSFKRKHIVRDCFPALKAPQREIVHGVS